MPGIEQDQVCAENVSGLRKGNTFPGAAFGLTRKGISKIDVRLLMRKLQLVDIDQPVFYGIKHQAYPAFYL